MTSFNVKVTWVDTDGFAICAGLDEEFSVEAPDRESAIRAAEEDARHFASESGRTLPWLERNRPVVEVLS